VSTGQLGSSLFTAMWRFVRTRIIIAVLIYILGLAFSIQGPVRNLFCLAYISVGICKLFTSETKAHDELL
jgi:hypothetical protein